MHGWPPAVTVGTVFAAAVSLPAAFIYSAASSSHPLMGAFPRVLAAHVVTTMMACACTFLGLMSLRALVAICAGERIADRLALVLQFVTIVMLVETFLFLPAVLPDIIKARCRRDAPRTHGSPPVWFTALFMWMAEGSSFLGGHVVKAVSVTGRGHRHWSSSSAWRRPLDGPPRAGGAHARARERPGHAGAIDRADVGTRAGRA